MLRLLIVSILLVAVKTENSVDQFLGDWLPAVTFPTDRENGSFCHWFNFKKENNWKCTCGDQETPVMKLKNNDDQSTKIVPVIVMGETEDAISKLNNCVCGTIQIYPIVIKKINENSFVVFGAMPHGHLVDYFTVLFVKKVPKLPELQALLSTVPYLRDKKPEYMCPLSYFA